MKLSKTARNRLRIATVAEQKKVAAAARTLADYDLITTSRAIMILRNVAAAAPGQRRL